MLRKILFVALLFGSTSLLAQNGTLTGVVTDAKTGEAVIGANAVIQGTTVGAATDLEGKFTIANLKPGTYDLAISFITYKTHLLKEVVVESGKVTSLAIALQEDATELQEVVVTGTREINNDMALLSAIKDSKLVVSGISAEQIVKLPDNDAAQVMRRVPGITIVDNRFVMVRGVPERYNQVMMNNAIAPSTELDKRSFSFDLVSSGALDQLLIYKSGSPDLPGDFAGGVIKIVTKETANEDYFKFGVNMGYRVGTTFNDFKETERSGTDFLGFDRSLRGLPQGFPSTQELRNAGTIDPIREKAGNMLNNSFGFENYSAPVDHGFNFGLGKKFSIGRTQVSTVSSFSYSNSYLSYESDLVRYSEFDTDESTPSVTQFDFNDNNYTRENKVGAISNWLIKFNDRHRIDFKNLFVQIGENKAIFREGSDIGTQGGALNLNTSYQFVSRSIYTGQLQGQHSFSNNSVKLDWVAGVNRIARNEPDFRRFRSIFDETEQKYRLILPPSSNLFDASRFYSDLVDQGYTQGANIQKIFGDASAKRAASIKAGYLIDYKERTFNARYFSFLFPGIFDGALGDQISFIPFDRIFSNENKFALNSNGTVSREGLALQEGTDLSGKDSYKGNALTTAAYLMGTLPVGKFDITGGLRLEVFNQELSAYNGDTLVVNNVVSPLPFFNVAYNLTDRSLIRAAYGRTVNRPEFRELAPFLFYQFEYNLNIEGEPDLKTSTIDNVDVRWELYPNPGESVSLGAFYKKFENPIEFRQVPAGTTVQFSYQNAQQAVNYGLELEVRKSFASLGASRFLRNTSVNLNASLIQSEVDLGNAVNSNFQERYRPLQGQSPYVINSGVYYNDPDKKLSVNVAYNVFGNRIFAVGSVLFPSWIERPRNAVDVQVSKEFRNMEVKLNVQNLLNAPYRFYQDNDESFSVDEKIDDPLQVYRTGQLCSLSVSWKLAKD